ncbi:MAG: hypothetical protein WC217_02565 [Candidatus Paceibacterota bacterium]|jgi:hypothetical protein
MDSIPSHLRSLWEEGFFKEEVPKTELVMRLATRGVNCSADTLNKALNRNDFLLSRRHKGAGLVYIQKKPAISRVVDTATTELFDESLVRSLGRAFEQEVADLHLNFGKSGTCTAFLLRKVLEKLIYIGFARQGVKEKLDDGSGTGRLVGLEAMIDIASKEKVAGIPFLTPHTAKEVKGIKFLGDVSAHNPLANVDMKDVIPQMPYITTAYKELAHHL